MKRFRKLDSYFYHQTNGGDDGGVVNCRGIFVMIISKQWIHLCSMFRWRYHHRIHSHLINIKTLVQPIIWMLIEKENKTNKNEIEQWDIEYGFWKAKLLIETQNNQSFQWNFEVVGIFIGNFSNWRLIIMNNSIQYAYCVTFRIWLFSCSWSASEAFRRIWQVNYNHQIVMHPIEIFIQLIS